eukprot:366519-Chlamydomonas_euryale.AAC.27
MEGDAPSSGRKRGAEGVPAARTAAAADLPDDPLGRTAVQADGVTGADTGTRQARAEGGPAAAGAVLCASPAWSRPSLSGASPLMLAHGRVTDLDVLLAFVK